MDGFPFIIIVIFIAVTVVALLASWFAAQQRRKALAAWAAAHGLAFDPETNDGVENEFPDFECFRRGSGRRAYNCMVGTWGGRAFLAFDYRYTTGSGKNRHTHTFSAVILRSPVPLRPLYIRPEGLFDKVAAFFGAEDINFESAEFSRKFFVKSPDRKWAYDVIHPRTIEFLLASPVFTIQFSPTDALAFHDEAFSPETFEAAAEVLAGVLDRMPEYLVREQTGQP
jgi:hypothetical protein